MNNILILVLGDALISLVAVSAGSLMRFGKVEPLDGEHLLRLSVFIAVALTVSYLLELYNKEKHTTKREIFLRVLPGVVISFFALAAAYYLVGIPAFFRGMFLATLVAFGVLQFLWHVSYSSFVNSPGLARRVLVLGAGPLAKKIGELILTTNHQHILKGYVNLSGESVKVPSESIVGNGHGLLATVREEKAHKLVVSLSERRGVFPLRDVMNCKFSGVEVIDAPTFYEEITGKLLIENTTPSWFIFSNGFRMTYARRLYKRSIDTVFSVIGLALTLPFLPLVALLIKLDSRGPVFLRQVRVGEMEKEFVLYKFRTMRQDAEKGTGAVWAQKNDPRVTRVGGFFRKTRIDELPQLYNVLKGEMSFVGPRPERPEFINELKTQIPYYSERHFVKPGVTGWAQIRYPYGASVEDSVEKLRYDLYYIKNISLFLDLQILFETVKVMLFRRGAR
jgi:sugar transferase (PEP-CTERM system associated)